MSRHARLGAVLFAALALTLTTGCEDPAAAAGAVIDVQPSTSTTVLRQALTNARPGDTVVLHDDPDQPIDFPNIQYVGGIDPDPGGTGRVTITADPGTVTAGFTFAAGARHLTVQGVHVEARPGQSGVSIREGTSDITLDQVRIVGGTRSVTVNNTGGPVKPERVTIVASELVGSTSDAVAVFGARDVTVQTSTLHPVLLAGTADHVDGLYATGVTGLAVIGNAIRASWSGGYGGPHQGIIVGPLHAGEPWGAAEIRGNTIGPWPGTGIIITDRVGSEGSTAGNEATFADVTLVDNHVTCANGGVIVKNWTGLSAWTETGTQFTGWRDPACPTGG